MYDDQCRKSVTHLIRKHVAGDLVGNNVRVICKDVVQNRAMILSWNKIQGKLEAATTALASLFAATN